MDDDSDIEIIEKDDEIVVLDEEDYDPEDIVSNMTLSQSTVASVITEANSTPSRPVALPLVNDEPEKHPTTLSPPPTHPNHSIFNTDIGGPTTILPPPPQPIHPIFYTDTDGTGILDACVPLYDSILNDSFCSTTLKPIKSVVSSTPLRTHNDISPLNTNQTVYEAVSDVSLCCNETIIVPSNAKTTNNNHSFDSNATIIFSSSIMPSPKITLKRKRKQQKKTKDDSVIFVSETLTNGNTSNNCIPKKRMKKVSKNEKKENKTILLF